MMLIRMQSAAGGDVGGGEAGAVEEDPAAAGEPHGCDTGIVGCVTVYTSIIRKNLQENRSSPWGKGGDFSQYNFMGKYEKVKK